MNIVLIGYRGTGKSVVGQLVAAELGLECVAMDAEIVARAGCSIADIVAQHGWPHFRDLEAALAAELAGRDNLVIDTGGGIIERSENMAALGATGLVVWLQARVATIVGRIAGDTARPSLTGAKSFTEEVAEVLLRRTPLYQQAAHHAIVTDPLTPEQIAAQVLALWRSKTVPERF